MLEDGVQGQELLLVGLRRLAPPVRCLNFLQSTLTGIFRPGDGFLVRRAGGLVLEMA